MRSFQINRHHSETCGADGKDCDSLENFRQAVAASTVLQEKVLKVRSDAEFVALGKENGYFFTQEDVSRLQPDSENGATCGCC